MATADPDPRPADTTSATPPPATPPGGLPARRLALELLRAVLHRRRPLDEAIEAAGDTTPEGATLAPRDRAFARALAATTLRRLGEIDALIAAVVERPLPRRAVAARDVLRLGIAQVLMMGTPPHAAVATSVDLVAAVGLESYKGLVNAVLRRLQREGADRLAALDGAVLNTPAWLWESWTRAYGEATARAIAAAHLVDPPLDLTVRGDPATWARRLEGIVLPTGTVRRAAGGPVADLPGYAGGEWWVQDAAAALPARLMGDVDGLSVCDLCAAPGGKTAQLAAAGARVTAVDRSATRLERLEANLARLGLEAERVVADATVWEPDAPFDAVLVDAPCTATGTIRRHPDIPRLKSADDVAALAALQRRLLARAVALVRPGGTIVWCTCSLQPQEGAVHVDALRDQGAPIERVPIDPAEVGGLAESVTRQGDVRTLPCHAADWGAPPAAEGAGGIPGGLDGFFIARLRRTA
ncbi:MAG: transcription antitermination factor NusB [Azospirillaceae bacterium]